MGEKKAAILVVDDEEVIRGILCRKLGADGMSAMWRPMAKRLWGRPL